MNYRPTLVLVRGIPGSGKTTFAQALLDSRNWQHHEHDQFFTDKYGQYHFDLRRMDEANAWCLAQTKADMCAGKSVVVSNTFTTMKEMAPYLVLAKELNYQLYVVEACAVRNDVHGVPVEAKRRMCGRWELFSLPKGYHDGTNVIDFVA